jgi:hypothetical protein
MERGLGEWRWMNVSLYECDFGMHVLKKTK